MSSAVHTLASVDLGSNSFHMKIVRIVGNQLHVIDRMREMVQLASGLDHQNRLSFEVQERAFACLEKFGQRLKKMPVASVRVVGTNTLRKAKNSYEFIRKAEQLLGHPIEIIAGREEARLIYLGVAHSVDSAKGHRLVIDIGGGSTELIIGEAFQPKLMESLYMGCVSMSQRYFSNGQMTKQAFRQAEISALLSLQPVMSQFRYMGWDAVFGASGTIRTIAKIVEAQGWSSSGITLESLALLKQLLLDIGRVDKLPFDDINERRKQVLPGGFVVLFSIFQALDIAVMQASSGAVREGLIYDLLGRIHHEDIRERTIAHLSSRYQVDQLQAKRVETCALKLYQQVESIAKDYREEYQELLSWGARLHEIGLSIAHSRYHYHGEYLLANSDLPGFSRQTQKKLACLVRLHRRKFNLDVLNEQAYPETMMALCIILRLAVLFYRSRSDMSVELQHFDIKKRAVTLVFHQDWLAQHPLTQADLELEQTYLQAANIKFEFASA